MKTCPHCGALLADDAVFCAACGASLSAYPPTQPGFVQNPAIGAVAYPKPPRRIKIWPFLVAILVMAAIAVGCVLMFSGDKAVEAVEDYYEALNQKDAEAAMMLRFPEPVLDYWEDYRSPYYDEYGYFIGYQNRDEDAIEDEFEYLFDQWDYYYGSDWEQTYEIKSVKELEGNRLEEVQDFYDKRFDMDVTAVKKITVKWEIEGSRNRDDREENAIKYPKPEKSGKMVWTVYQYEDNWYLDDIDYYY